MSNIWDDQEPFRDNPVEYTNGGWKEKETYTPAPENTLSQRHVQSQEINEEYVEELTEQVAQEEEEEDYTDVLSDARLRLEQGRLYEMVIQHSLFENLDADPRAIKSVQNQIRKFARERMEIMLGIRQEETVVNNSFIPSPFNELEVNVLKKLASAATKGATETEEANTAQQPTPIASPKKTTLNSIGSQPKKQQPKPIQSKSEPIKRAPKLQVNKQKKNDDYDPLNKPIHEMTQEELAERDRLSLEKQKTMVVIPKDRLPQPDYGQMEMIAASQVSRATGGSGISGLNGKLSQLIINRTKS